MGLLTENKSWYCESVRKQAEHEATVFDCSKSHVAMDAILRLLESKSTDTVADKRKSLIEVAKSTLKTRSVVQNYCDSLESAAKCQACALPFHKHGICVANNRCRVQVEHRDEIMKIIEAN